VGAAVVVIAGHQDIEREEPRVTVKWTPVTRGFDTGPKGAGRGLVSVAHGGRASGVISSA
jgi:hypothetical protein